MIEMFHVSHLEQMDLDKSQLVMGTDIYEKYGKITGPAKTLIMGSNVVASAGIERLWPGVGDAWMIVSKHVFDYPITTAKQCRKLFPEMAEGLHRIQALVLARFKKGHEFVQFMGFQYEGLSEKYGPNQENYCRYVILR